MQVLSCWQQNICYCNITLILIVYDILYNWSFHDPRSNRIKNKKTGEVMKYLHYVTPSYVKGKYALRSSKICQKTNVT